MKSISDIGGTVYDRAVQLVNTVGFGKSVKREGLGKTLKHVWKGSDYLNSEKPSLESLNDKIDNVEASIVKLQNNNQTKFGEIMAILQKMEASPPPHSPPTPSPTPTPRRAPIPPLLQKVNEIRGKPAEKGNGKSKPEKENGNKQGNENGKNGNKQGNENGKNGGNNKQGNKEGEKGGNNKEDDKNGGNKEAENVNQESATATKPDDDETDDDEAGSSSVIINTGS